MPRIGIGGINVPFVTVETGPHYGSPVSQWIGQELKFLVPLPRYLLEAIEESRTHDLQISVGIELRYHVAGGGPMDMLQVANGYMQLNISQKQWLDALAVMGYHGGWVIEVERPVVEGWPRAVEFLDRAWDRIVARDAEGAVGQCRAVWESLIPLIDAASGGISTEIDRGSTAEADEPKKSERIATLRKATLKWTHTGAHPENYAASMDDALLAYRMTASLVSYLSQKAAAAETRSRSGVEAKVS